LEQALLLSWAAFTATFGTTRAITHLLKCRDSGSGGSGGIVIGGKRLHHYNLGIMLLTASAAWRYTARSTAAGIR